MGPAWCKIAGMSETKTDRDAAEGGANKPPTVDRDWNSALRTSCIKWLVWIGIGFVVELRPPSNSCEVDVADATLGATFAALVLAGVVAGFFQLRLDACERNGKLQPLQFNLSVILTSMQFILVAYLFWLCRGYLKTDVSSAPLPGGGIEFIGVLLLGAMFVYDVYDTHELLERLPKE